MNNNNSQALTKCICCGAPMNPNMLYRVNHSDIYRCDNCGLGLADVKDFDANDYYDADYFSGEYDDGYSDYQGSQAVLDIQFKHELEDLKALIGPQQTLLELGCAYGYFLRQAEPMFEQVYGLEICQDAVDDCRKRGMGYVYQGEISATTMEQFPDVDVVAMLDVIEHLPQPHEAVKAIAEKLNPGGHLLLTTGDFSSTVAKLSGKKWRLMTPPQHLWFFTPKSIEELIEPLGCELVKVDYPAKKVSFGLIIFQLCRFLKFRPKLPMWFHNHGIKVNLFDAMRVVIRKKKG